MAVWPTTLTKPDMNSYQITTTDAVLRTEMDSGSARTRRQFTYTPEFVEVKFKFSLAQLGIYEKFWRQDINQGADWFDIALTNGAGENVVEARFVGVPKRATTARENHWVLSAKLEVRNFPVIS